jgi:hypothetical protein
LIWRISSNFMWYGRKIGFSIAVWGVANLNSGSENKVCQFWYRNEAM